MTDQIATDRRTDADDQGVLRHVGEIARERGLRLCVAESLTSGRLAAAVGAGDETERWFGGGILAYQASEKERILGVTPGIDPCSAECAEQLASGALRLFDADLCVATTGVGGPDPDENGHALGTVYLGWASSEGVGHRRLAFEGDPVAVLDQTVDAAISLLAFHVESLRSPGPRRQGSAP